MFHSDFFTKDMQSKDNKYTTINKRIRDYREAFLAGKMSDILDQKWREEGVATRSKYIKVNTCGWIPLSHASSVEQDLMKCLE